MDTKTFNDTLDAIDLNIKTSQQSWHKYDEMWFNEKPYSDRTDLEKMDFEHKRAAHFRQLASAQAALLELIYKIQRGRGN